VPARRDTDLFSEHPGPTLSDNDHPLFKPHSSL
jgi:hypothetical protein